MEVLDKQEWYKREKVLEIQRVENSIFTISNFFDSYIKYNLHTFFTKIISNKIDEYLLKLNIEERMYMKENIKIEEYIEKDEYKIFFKCKHNEEILKILIFDLNSKMKYHVYRYLEGREYQYNIENDSFMEKFSNETGINRFYLWLSYLIEDWLNRSKWILRIHKLYKNTLLEIENIIMYNVQKYINEYCKDIHKSIFDYFDYEEPIFIQMFTIELIDIRIIMKGYMIRIESYEDNEFNIKLFEIENVDKENIMKSKKKRFEIKRKIYNKLNIDFVNIEKELKMLFFSILNNDFIYFQT